MIAAVFTNRSSGETSFKIVAYGSDADQQRALIEALAEAMPRAATIGEPPGGAGLVFDPVLTAADVRGRYVYIACDDTDVRTASLANADCGVVVATSIEERARLLQSLQRDAPELPCRIVAALEPLASDAEEHDDVLQAPLADGKGVFKLVAKIVLTARRRGRLLEGNPGA